MAEGRRVLDTRPCDVVVELLVLKVDALYVLWHAERDRQSFAPQIRWQLVEDLEVQVQLAILLFSNESREHFDRQHVEGSFALVLEGNALAKRRRELQLLHIRQLLPVDRLMDLCDANLLPILLLSKLALGKSASHTVLAALQDTVVEDIEHVVEQYFAVDLADDVVLHEHEPVHSNPDRESVRVEARADLLVDFDKNIIRRLPDTPLAVFF